MAADGRRLAGGRGAADPDPLSAAAGAAAGADLFGYIARVARVGTIEALDADYTRTAVLKGLPWRAVLRRHVLRNALLPTITVIASLIGYLTGGLVVVETLFHYPGIGGLIYSAARAKDFPMLEAGVLTVGAIYALAASAGGHLAIARSIRACARRGLNEVRRWRRLAAALAARCLTGVADPGLLDRVRAVRPAHVDRSTRIADDLLNALAPPSAHALVRHRPARPRRVLAGHRRRARHPDRGAAGDAARHGARRRCSGSSSAISAASSTTSSSRVIEALLALPLVIVALMALAAVGTSNGP